LIDYFSIIHYGGVCFNGFFRILGQYDLATNVCFNLTDPSLQPLSLAKVFVFWHIPNGGRQKFWLIFLLFLHNEVS
jgi:hypothetical protein